MIREWLTPVDMSVNSRVVKVRAKNITPKTKTATINILFFLQANKYGFLGKINLHPSALVVWTAMYNRFDAGLLPRENTNDVTLSTMEHVGILEAHLASLQSVRVSFFTKKFKILQRIYLIE